VLVCQLVLQIPSGEGGLNQNSVALCHQLRVLDKARLIKKIGQLAPETIANLETIILFTLDYN
jgi:mRNA interferase MazF